MLTSSTPPHILGCGGSRHSFVSRFVSKGRTDGVLRGALVLSLQRSRIIFGIAVLFACGAARVRAASDVVEDIRGLRHLQLWHESKDAVSGSPDQTCGISDPSDFRMLRFDMQLAASISDRDATAQVGVLDTKVSGFLKKHDWSVLKVASSGGGIPDLTRCYRKQSAIAQIYQTTGRCTMGSPCTAYDGFTIVMYLPKAPLPSNKATDR